MSTKEPPQTPLQQPNVDPDTAAAIIENCTKGLRPFLSLGREILKRDYPAMLTQATDAIAANEAREIITIEVVPDGVVISLCLIDPASTRPRPLFSLAGNSLPDAAEMH